MDIYGNTPLTYALEYSNSECIDLIITHFKEQPEKFIVTYNDLIMILRTNASIGFDVFNISFFTYSDLFQTQKRGILNNPYETVISDSEVLRQRDLDREKLDLDKETPGIVQPELAYLISRFSFNPVMGSNDSTSLLHLLKDTGLDSIWTTDFKYIIDYKWKKASVFLQTFSILHFLYLIAISVYATSYIDRTGFRAICFILTILFSLYEVLQIVAEGVYYFSEVWNLLDISGYVTFVIHTVLYMTGGITHGSMTFKAILSLAILLLWLRAIGDLRAFKNTRYLVRLVIETIRDLKSFMILLAVMLYTYSVV